MDVLSNKSFMIAHIEIFAISIRTYVYIQHFYQNKKTFTWHSYDNLTSPRTVPN